jgi:hypothetical protein
VRKAALIALVALGVGVVVLSELAPTLARRKMVAAVNGNCDGCQFDMDRLRLHPMTGEVVAEGVRYHGNPNDFVELSFTIASLSGHIAWLPLLHGTWQITDLAAVQPAFQIIEKDPKPLSRPSSPSFPLSVPPLTVATVSVRDGRFTYIHRLQGKQDAPIRITHVDGAARDFSTREGLGSSKTTFEVKSQLERSGASTITASFDLFANPNDDHLTVDLQHQPLAEMDPYFFNTSGVRLDGHLERATATMRIRNGVLSGDLAARYHDLAVHYYKTAGRSAIGAFFSDTAEKLTLRSEQPPADVAAPATAGFQVARIRGDSVINFLLSGLKPAAHDILTGKTPHPADVRLK